MKIRHVFHRRKKGPSGPFFWVGMILFVGLLAVVGGLLAGRFFLGIGHVPAVVRSLKPTDVRPPKPPPVVSATRVRAVPTEVPELEEGFVAVSKTLTLVNVPRVRPVNVPVPTEWRWKAHMKAVDAPPGSPKLAVMLDDMGDIDSETRVLKATSIDAVEKLPEAVTLSFFPWYADGIALARKAHARGHEIWVHMPMEPLKHGTETFDPGLNALTVGMSPASLRGLIAVNMAPLADVAVGFNNHMGSRFTKWGDGMRVVLEEAQKGGYAFVDSRTAGHTAVEDAARGLVLPVLVRDVFLDDKPGEDEVRQELHRAIGIAKQKGHALVIGHPLPDTLAVLEAELPRLQDAGVVLVPVSALIGR